MIRLSCFVILRPALYLLMKKRARLYDNKRAHGRRPPAAKPSGCCIRGAATRLQQLGMWGRGTRARSFVNFRRVKPRRRMIPKFFVFFTFRHHHASPPAGGDPPPPERLRREGGPPSPPVSWGVTLESRVWRTFRFECDLDGAMLLEEGWWKSLLGGSGGGAQVEVI